MARTVVFIPCRRGTTRFEGKNKALYQGEPLFLRTIKQAKRLEFVDEVIMSTDDHEILKASAKEGISVYVRPPHLATPTSPTWDAIKYHLLKYPPSTIIILLQVTSPLRTDGDIRRAFTLFLKNNCPVISGHESEDGHSFMKNGAIYITRLEWEGFAPCHCDDYLPRLYLMPPERGIDIDYKYQLEELNDRINIDNEQFDEPHEPGGAPEPLYTWHFREREREPDGADNRAN